MKFVEKTTATVINGNILIPIIKTINLLVFSEIFKKCFINLSWVSMFTLSRHLCHGVVCKPYVTTALVHNSLFNDHDLAESSFFYIKQRQVKTEWGVSRREGEREREKQIKGERDGS